MNGNRIAEKIGDLSRRLFFNVCGYYEQKSGYKKEYAISICDELIETANELKEVLNERK